MSAISPVKKRRGDMNIDFIADRIEKVVSPEYSVIYNIRISKIFDITQSKAMPINHRDRAG